MCCLKFTNFFGVEPNIFYVIASTSPESQDACKRNMFLYNGALYEALAVMTDGPMVLRTRLRAWFRRWRMYDW